jgi:hypothetical protein
MATSKPQVNVSGVLEIHSGGQRQEIHRDDMGYHWHRPAVEKWSTARESSILALIGKWLNSLQRDVKLNVSTTGSDSRKRRSEHLGIENPIYTDDIARPTFVLALTCWGKTTSRPLTPTVTKHLLLLAMVSCERFMATSADFLLRS